MSGFQLHLEKKDRINHVYTYTHNGKKYTLTYHLPTHSLVVTNSQNKVVSTFENVIIIRPPRGQVLYFITQNTRDVRSLLPPTQQSGQTSAQSSDLSMFLQHVVVPSQSGASTRGASVHHSSGSDGTRVYDILGRKKSVYVSPPRGLTGGSAGGGGGRHLVQGGGGGRGKPMVPRVKDFTFEQMIQSLIQGTQKQIIDHDTYLNIYRILRRLGSTGTIIPDAVVQTLLTNVNKTRHNPLHTQELKSLFNLERQRTRNVQICSQHILGTLRNKIEQGITKLSAFGHSKFIQNLKRILEVAQDILHMELSPEQKRNTALKARLVDLLNDKTTQKQRIYLHDDDKNSTGFVENIYNILHVIDYMDTHLTPQTLSTLLDEIDKESGCIDGSIDSVYSKTINRIIDKKRPFLMTLAQIMRQPEKFHTSHGQDDKPPLFHLVHLLKTQHQYRTKAQQEIKKIKDFQSLNVSQKLMKDDENVARFLYQVYQKLVE